MGHTFQKQPLWQQAVHHHQRPDHLLANVWSSLLQPTDTYKELISQQSGGGTVCFVLELWIFCQHRPEGISWGFSPSINSCFASMKAFIPAQLLFKISRSKPLINISFYCVHTDPGGTTGCHSVWAEVKPTTEGCCWFDLKLKHHLFFVLVGPCSQTRSSRSLCWVLMNNYAAKS